MAAYEALYRKWRPQTFDDIVAQPHITRTLKNQIIREKSAHAYLFTGSRGTGKTTCARIFAKAINCLHPKDGNPCLECEICKAAERGTLTDLIEIDGASNNGVDEVRNLRDNATFLPVECKYKVYIIDEVHMMSTAGFNALLKIIEEPPAYVKFVFATTEIHKVPATILSRCQRFDFRRILPADIVKRIQYIAEHESFSISKTAAYRIATLADGGLRDALSLLDQCTAVSEEIDTDTVEDAIGIAGNDSVFEILRCIAAHDTTSALQRIDLLYRQSKDMTRFADEISQQLRNLMLMKTVPDDPVLLPCMPDEYDILESIAADFTMGEILAALTAVRQCCDRMTRASNKRMELEMTLIHLCSDLKAQKNDMKVMQSRITELEGKLLQLEQNGVQVAAPKKARNAEPPKNIPARNLQVEEKAETTDSYVPVKNWQSVLERFEEINPSVTGLLQNSNAFLLEEKHLLLLVVRNRLFRQLFNQQDALALGAAAAQVLGGERYTIRFRTEESEDDHTAPVDILLQRAKQQGITVETRE